MNILGKMVPLAAILTVGLAGCGDGGSSSTGATGSTSSSSSGGVTSQSVDVTPCLNQKVGARSVAQLVVPDAIQLNLSQPSGFPNGRKLLDPVIDVTLAVLFLNRFVPRFWCRVLCPLGAFLGVFARFSLFGMEKDHSKCTDCNLCLVPWLGAAQGVTPASGVGSGFVFRTDAPSAYTRVDRMGMPAVATALVSSANKTAYNDDTPLIDASGKWVPELTSTLKGLTTALADDLASLKLTPCAKIS